MSEQDHDAPLISEPAVPADTKGLGALAERVASLEQRLETLEAKVAGAGSPMQTSGGTEEPRGAVDLESYFAGPFLHYVGLLALLVGLALLIGYWMEAFPLASLLLAGLSALLLAGMGQWMRRHGSETFSLTLEGSAFGLLYVACYLSYGWGGLVWSLAAGSGVLLLAMTRAVRRNSQLVASFALLAALLGPLLLRSARAGESFLFGYLAAINTAAVWTGRRNGWLGLRFLALLGSHLVAWLWYGSHPTAQLPLTAAFPILTFFLFAGVVPAKPLSAAEVFLGMGNSAGFLAASASLLHVHFPAGVPWVPLGLGTLHLLLGLCFRSSASLAQYAPLHWWLGAFLLAVCGLWALPAVAAAMAWTAESLLLAWIGTRRNQLAWRRAANLLALAAAALLLRAVQTSPADSASSLLLPATAAFTLAIFLMHRWAEQDGAPMGNWEWAAHWLLAVIAVVLPALALNQQLSLRRSGQQLSSAAPLLTSLCWAGYSLLLCVVGWLWFSAFLRWMGVALLLITTVKVFLVDPLALSSLSRIVSFLSLAAFLLLLSYLFQTRRP